MNMAVPRGADAAHADHGAHAGGNAQAGQATAAEAAQRLDAGASSARLGSAPHHSPQQRVKPRRARPGWKPTLIRQDSFDQLRAIQKSSCDPHLDLGCLSDACIALALQMGARHIVEKAIADLRSRLLSSCSSSPSIAAVSSTCPSTLPSSAE